MNTILNFFNSSGFMAPLAIAGLIVLTALGRVGADVTVPLIVGLAGVHTGANLTNTTTAAPTTPVQQRGQGPIQ